jgi:CHAT domain-containing protein
MWTPASTPRSRQAGPRGRFTVIVLLALLLSACGSGGVTQTRSVLSEQCQAVSGRHESSLSVLSPEEGFLRLQIVERGVSIVATLDANPGSAAESPVERLGTIHLIAHTGRQQRHTIAVQTQDSPDITGEYCVRADLIAPADRETLSAETAFAAAGRATHGHDWSAAFADYLDAARRFDRLSSRRSAGAARQAMAELAYLRFDNKRDSYALASQALADYGAATEPLTLGALTILQVKALLDMPGTDVHAVEPKVRRLQAIARRYFQTERFGAREVPRVDIMAGFFEYRLDAFAQARARFATAAQSCRSQQDWDCYAIAIQDVALLEFEGKNYSVALSTLSEALSSLPQGLDPKDAADIWTNYGFIQGRTGLYSGSEHSLATAMRVYAQLGDCQGARRNLARSGNLLAQLGSLSDAMHLLQLSASLKCSELLAAADRAENEVASAQPASAGSLRSLPPAREASGVVGWCTGPLDPQELAIDNKLIVFNSLVSLGDALMLEGEPALAERCLEAAGPYASNPQTRMHLADARGRMLLDRQDATGAQAAFQQAMKIARDAQLTAYEYYGRAQVDGVKATLLSGNASQTLQDALAALEASVSRGDIDQTVASLRLLATGYRGLNQQDRAARTLQTAVDLIEAVPIDGLDGEKRATFLATQYMVFAELTDLYAAAAGTDQSKAAMAFANSERGRARSLRFAVTQTERNVSGPESLPAARYQKLLQEFVNLKGPHESPTSANLVDKLDTVALREHTNDERFDELRITPTLGELQATLIEYAVGTRDMFAFVVNESGLQVVRLGDRTKIATAAADLHDRLLDAETPPDEVREAARRLAELVLWPLTPHLSGRRLIIVPDDGLHTVPFNVLPWSARKADLLVLQHAEVSIVPSALFLSQVHARNTQHSRTPRIELLGDPVFRMSDWQHECIDPFANQTSAKADRAVSDWTESLPRLPGSRAEVQMVARLSQQSRPGSHIEILLGCAAVPAALRRAATGDVELLHIATHARVDSQRPRLSALALTPEHRGDGTASAFGLLDILNLKLNSSLVVLSACETSRGRLLPGEGVLGPAQAFLQAGAAAVLASYWRVDDLTTSRFMQEFYRYLLIERLPAATALRKAQIEAAGSASPHDWAAFSLYGWPDSSI